MSLSYGFSLSPPDSSAQFSDAFHALTGDGISGYGDRFSLDLENFTLTIGTGFAIANGRYLKNDKPYSITVPPSGNTYDRDDAVVIRVDYAAKKAYLALMVDVDADSILADPSTLRNDAEYCILLYLIHVKRGTTVLKADDVTDTRGDKKLCGYITPTDAISGDILRIDEFLRSGIDQEVARILAQGDAAVDKADKAIADINAAIASKDTVKVGNMEFFHGAAPSNAWLLCDGSAVPPEYPALSALVGGTLPTVTLPDARFHAFIYVDKPVHVEIFTAGEITSGEV